jgi:cobalt-zinc-cadmium efflux system outer membrane protein
MKSLPLLNAFRTSRKFSGPGLGPGLGLGLLLILLACGCRSGKLMPERKYRVPRGTQSSIVMPATVTQPPTPGVSEAPASVVARTSASEVQKENGQAVFGRTTEPEGEASLSDQAVEKPQATVGEKIGEKIGEALPLEENSSGSFVTAVANHVDLSEETNGISLTGLIQLVLERNPQVEIVRRELDKACARITQVASLDDPMVDVQAWPIYPNVPQTAAGRMTADISISQTVPWRGKRAARVGEVSREVNGWQNRLLAIQLKIASEVKLAYFGLALAKERQDVVEQELKFLDQLYQRAEVLYETGKVGQQDLLRLKAERGMIEAEQKRWEQDQIEATAELLRLMQFDQQDQLGVDSRLPVELELNQSLDKSLQRASEASPELQALWADLQRDQWRVQQARLDYYPDLTLMVGWGGMTTRQALAPFADGIDNINTGVSFNLPVRKATRHASLRESESQAVQSLKQWELGRDDIARDVRQIHAQLDSQQTQLQLLNQTVIPRFLEAIEISLVAYESNQTDLTELINLRREVLKFKLIEKELRSQWHITKANLLLLVAEIDW